MKTHQGKSHPCAQCMSPQLAILTHHTACYDCPLSFLPGRDSHKIVNLIVLQHNGTEKRKLLLAIHIPVECQL